MLCLIGGGKMGRALAGGILGQGAEALTIVERNPQRVAFLNDWAAATERVSITSSAVSCDGAIIAVKPKDVEMAVSDAVGAGAQRILSIAAGVPLVKLHEWAGGRIPVLRAMPNIGAVEGASATALCGGSTAHEEDLAWATELLSGCGTVVRVQEDQMDAVTGLSGSGPAYLFLVAEAMIDAGVAAGLQRSVAVELTAQTFTGAAALLTKGDKSAAELRGDVMTPAGTTAAGLGVLENRALRGALLDAVLTASKRSRELGAPTSTH